MRDLNELNEWRIALQHEVAIFGGRGDAVVGAFEVPSLVDRHALRVIATSGNGWDHVSVSRATRCPNWIEMEFIAAMFFRADETAMQLHVPECDHVNNHAFCLHWWRPLQGEIPRPPMTMVGIKEAGELRGPEHAREVKDRFLAGFYDRP